MKKLALTLAIVLGLGMTTFAIPNEGGIFQRGTTPDQKTGIFGSRTNRDTTLPMFPNHGQFDDMDAETPLGAGIAVLSLLGGAYLVAKKRKEE